MPSRILRESIRTSETLALLSDGAERTCWRLVTVADDFGRFQANPKLVMAACYPLSASPEIEEKVSGHLRELAKVGMVTLYEVDGKTYGAFSNWNQYQRPPRGSAKPKHPGPEGAKPLMRALPGSAGQRRAVPGNARRCRPRAVSREPLAASTTETPPPPPNGGGADDSAAAPHWPSPEALVAKYNHEAPDECAAVVALSPGRRVKAKRYLAAFPESAWWGEVFAQMHRSKFLRGQIRPRDGNGRSFVAGFDWLLTKGRDGTENVVKVHDGNYLDAD